MRPDFQRDAAARHAPEDFLQRFCTRTNSLFQLYLTCLIHDAVPAVAIAQIQSDGQFLLRNIPTLRCRSDANLLHCRSPFYLCFEHVDNLGAYTASRPETGLLIPSDYATVHPRSALIQRDTKSVGIAYEIASAPCDSSRIHVRGLRLAREEHIAERSASSRSRTRCDCRWRTSLDRMRTGFCVPCMDSVFQIPISLIRSMSG